MADELVRILVVDDSALYRQMVKNVLRDIPGVEVVGVAKSGEEALEMLEQLTPDLLTLDVRMPGMDGIAVLKELKRRRSHAKALMLSSLTANGAQVTTDALFEGAFDFILKPGSPDAAANRSTLCDALLVKLQIFRDGFRDRKARRSAASAARTVDAPAKQEDDAETIQALSISCVVIGTSTGGPIALREVLPAIPGDFPVPVLIVQHMPARYTLSLAERLNEASQIEVVEGCDGMTLEPGWAYIAPGGRQMKIGSRAGKPVLRITDDPPENSCRPSADYLFRSAAETFGRKVIAVVMTGMGRDGAEGCRALKQQGAFIIAEHPDSCVVYGMPKAVIEENLADRVVRLERIGSNIVRRVKRSQDTLHG